MNSMMRGEMLDEYIDALQSAAEEEMLQELEGKPKVQKRSTPDD
jgi:hypothetical protein